MRPGKFRLTDRRGSARGANAAQKEKAPRALLALSGPFVVLVLSGPSLFWCLFSARVKRLAGVLPMTVYETLKPALPRCEEHRVADYCGEEIAFAPFDPEDRVTPIAYRPIEARSVDRKALSDARHVGFLCVCVSLMAHWSMVQRSVRSLFWCSGHLRFVDRRRLLLAGSRMFAGSMIAAPGMNRTVKTCWRLVGVIVS